MEGASRFQGGILFQGLGVATKEYDTGGIETVVWVETRKKTSVFISYKPLEKLLCRKQGAGYQDVI